MPTSIGTIDTTKVRNGNYQDQYGVATYYRSPAINYMGIVQKTNVANRVRIVGPNGSNEWSPATSVPVATAAGDGIELEFTVPIAQWAGSGTVQLAQNDVEYAFNTSTSTTVSDTNTTSFGYGPSGAQIQNIAATLRRRVRFQTPIQPGDKLTLEISTDTTGNTWMPLEFGGLTDNTTWRISPFQRQNTAAYGVGNVIRVNSTDVDVQFAGAACEASGVGFGVAGEPWSNGGGSRYWRVRKQSAGAAVGFGIVAPGVSAGLVSASGLPGNTTGNVIATGFVGQVTALSTGTGTVTPAASTVWKDIETLTLTAGVWLVYGAAAVYWTAATPPTSFTQASFGLTTTANGTPTMWSSWQGSTTASGVADNGFGLPLAPIVVVTDGVTNNIVRAVGSLRYGTLNTLVFDANSTSIQAVRIA
jgi:hypothetical protein